MEQFKMHKSMFIVEGNVGVGKTTFLQFLQKQMLIDIALEPTPLWQNIVGDNVLEQFFINPKRWSYTFQSYILLTLIDQMIAEQKKTDQKPCFFERSIFSGRYVFGSVAHEVAWMNDLEWNLYQRIWQRELDLHVMIPSGFIYLKTSAQVCYNRIVQRARFEEKPITIDYLMRLEKKYDDWFFHRQGIGAEILHVPVLILDLSSDWLHDSVMQEKLSLQILDFMKKAL